MGGGGRRGRLRTETIRSAYTRSNTRRKAYEKQLHSKHSRKFTAGLLCGASGNGWINLDIGLRIQNEEAPWALPAETDHRQS